MKKVTFITMLAFLTGFLFLIPQDVQAGNTTKTLPAIADTYVSSEHPMTNYGDYGVINLTYITGGSGHFEAILIKFDLSSIHDNAVIHSASMNLFMSSCSESIENISIKRLTTDWIEDDAVYNNAMSNSIDDMITKTDVPCVHSGKWYNFYINDIVKNWVAGQPNYGVYMKMSAPRTVASRTFESRTSATTWARPQLVVSYDYPDPPAAAAPASSQPVGNQPAPSSSNSINPTDPAASTNTPASSSSESNATSNANEGVSNSSVGSAAATISEKESLGGFATGLLKNKTNTSAEKWPYTLNMLQRRLLVGGILLLIIGLIWGIKILLRQLKNSNTKSKEENKLIESNGGESMTQSQPEQTQKQQPQVHNKALPSGNKSNKVIVIIVIVLIVLGAGGYLFSQFAARKTGEKIAEKILETGTGGKVDIDTNNGGAKLSDGNTSFSTGSSAKWPDNLPVGAPKYSGGKITSVTETPESWSILLGETNRTQFDAYKASLTSNGWTSTGNAQVMIDTSQYQKSGWDLSISFDESSGAAIITVLKSLQ